MANDRVTKPDEADSHDRAILKEGTAKPDFGHLLSGQESLDLIRKLNVGAVAGGLASAEGSSLVHSLGIGGIDIKTDPFHKDYNDPNESGWESTWRGIKGAFGFHDTVEDKIREREISHLTPEQKKQYEKEEAALHAYMTQANINPGKPPDMPMHQMVDHKVAEFEKSVRDKVLAGMTPQQRKEMEEEGKQWESQYHKIHAHDNPMGGPFAQPKDPPLGPTTTWYEAECKRKAEEELRK